MSFVFDGEHAVGPSPLALLPQKIPMWGPTVGVISVYLYISDTSIYIPVYLYIRIFVYSYICIFVYLYFCIFVYLYICIFAYLHICIVVYLYMCLSVYLYIFVPE